VVLVGRMLRRSRDVIVPYFDSYAYRLFDACHSIVVNSHCQRCNRLCISSSESCDERCGRMSCRAALSRGELG
jgi:hypothetical protein